MSGRRITDMEWQLIMPPFHVANLSPEFTRIDRDIIMKWLPENAAGWWYVDPQVSQVVFEREDDMMLLTLFGTSLNNSTGTVK